MIAIKDEMRNRSWTSTNLRQAAFARGFLARLLMGVAALAFGPAVLQADEAGTAASAGAPASVPTASSIDVTIRQTSQSPKQITVTVGHSAVVELSEPVKRVQVGTPEIAEVKVLTPRQLLVTGQGVGRSQLILWDEKEGQLILNLFVQLDLGELRAAIEQIAPGSDVRAQAVHDTVVLMGTVPDVDSAQRIEELAKAYSPKLQNSMKVAGMHQVMLRCTVAEVNKRAIRQLGLNGWLAGDNVRDMFAVSQIGGINPSPIFAAPAGLANVIVPPGVPFGIPTGGIPLRTDTQFSLGFPRLEMQLFFRALRQNNLLRVLAEPNLIALSGQEASFLAGGEFPIPVPQNAYGTVTIEWRQYGVRLKFTPTVIGRQMIRLKVTPEVSEQDMTAAVQLAGYVVPALRTRTASTVIELASGSTIAIAGLLSEQARAQSDKIPGLGDVPVLGALFSSVDYQRNLSELVIMVTPELVDSMHPDQVPAVPGQHMSDPNDWELFGLGMIEGEPLSESENDARALDTDYAPKYRKFRSPPEQTSLHGPWGQADASETVQ